MAARLPLPPNLWVLAFEMTGYGESIPPGKDRDISVDAQADRLIAWIEHLGLGPVTLVGPDLGGGVVHIAAVRRPDLCAGLMITNGIGYDSWPIPSVKAMRAAAPVLSRLPAVALKPAFAMLLARGHDDASVAKESLAIPSRPYDEHGGGAAMARQVTALDVQDTIAVQDRTWFAATLRDGFALAAGGRSQPSPAIGAAVLRGLLSGLELSRPLDEAVSHVLDASCITSSVSRSRRRVATRV